jgi:hypothetical protein
MHSFRFLPFLAAILFASAFAMGQPHATAVPPKPQTARQALIEMVTKGGDAIQKHLTLEVQELLKSDGKSDPAMTKFQGRFALFPSLGEDKNLHSFETGDILFAYGGSSQDRFEVHVDNDDLAGDEASLLLSLHTFRDGKEQEESLGLFMSSHFTVSMKLQQNVWRLNKISMAAEVPVGDAKFIERAFLKPDTAIAYTGTPATVSDLHTEFVVHPNAGENSPAAVALMEPKQVVTMLALAETMFARMNPDAGFTCSLSELTEMSKMMGLDQQVNSGTYNGYRFALAGCEGKPAGSFQVTAEPTAAKPGAKSFCTDATQNVRVSDDARGATCLSSGKVQTEQTEDDGGMWGGKVGVSQPKE